MIQIREGVKEGVYQDIDSQVQLLEMAKANGER